MRSVWTVAAREYRERVRTPVFLITSLVVLLATLGMPIMMLFATGSIMAKTRHVALYDATGKVGADLLQYMEPDDRVAKNGVQRWELTPITQAQVKEYEQKVHDDKLFGLLLVDGSFPQQIKVTFEASGPSNLGEAGALTSALSGLAHAAQAKAAGLDAAIADQLTKEVPVERIDLASGGKQDETDSAIKIGLGMMVTMLVYISVLSSGSMLFQGVLEEKTNRVVELMATAVRPTHMMLGKMIGLGLLSLTQFSAALLAFGAFTLIAGAYAVQTGSIGLGALVLVAVLGLLGYALFAALFAAAGAMVNRMEESGMAMAPIMVPIILPVAFSSLIVNHPDGTLAVVCSLIPFFTPTVMAQRLVLTHPPLWQVVTSIVLLLGSIVLMTWLAGRIYKVGILSYGNRPSLKQLIAYLRA